MFLYKSAYLSIIKCRFLHELNFALVSFLFYPFSSISFLINNTAFGKKYKKYIEENLCCMASIGNETKPLSGRGGLGLGGKGGLYTTSNGKQ